MRPADLPHKQPQWAARPLSPQDVWRLAMGEPVPGLDLHDPRIQSIQRTRPDNLGRVALTESRQSGLLKLEINPFNPEWANVVMHLWGWWCAAARQPEIVIKHTRNHDDASLRCDLSPTGLRWTFQALCRLGQLLHDMPCHGGFLVTADTVEFDELEFPDAVEVGRELLSLARGASFTRPDEEKRQDDNALRPPRP